MIKILIIGGLLYILYNMVVKKSLLSGKDEDMKIDDRQSADDGEYVDYEEVD